MMPKLRVRKRRKEGAVSYRFTKGNIDWNRNDLEKIEGIEFDFAPNLTTEDRIAVCKMWSHKKMLPEHRLAYIDSIGEDFDLT